MPIEILVPRLGWSMDEGTFAEWLRPDGAQIKKGDMLFSLEGDKAAQDVECFDEGQLKLLPWSPRAGDKVKVGQVLAHLLSPEEAASAKSASPAGPSPAGQPATVVPQPVAGTGTPAAQQPPNSSTVATEPVKSGPATPAPAHQGSAAPAPVASPASPPHPASPGSANGDVPTSTVASSVVPVSANVSSEPTQSAAPTTDSRTAAASTSGGKNASPRARRLAEKLGVNWTLLTGTGVSGRIRERDILAVAQTGVASLPAVVNPVMAGSVPTPTEVSVPAPAPAAPVPAAAESATAANVSAEQVARVAESPAASVPAQPAPAPLSHRRTIAHRMMESHRATAPVTLTTTVDMSSLVGLRQQFREAGESSESLVPGYQDFLVRLVAMALRSHPRMNSRWENDDVVSLPDVHVGIAVDTEAGLVVPVIRDADQLNLTAIARRSRELIDRARTKRLTASEMQDGTFTITNLGSFGVDAFTPIINFPQCAVLGMGQIRKQPVFEDGQFVARDQITLSLTFDHRIVDGAPAARFLQSLVRSIEQPGQLLIG